MSGFLAESDASSFVQHRNWTALVCLAFDFLTLISLISPCSTLQFIKMHLIVPPLLAALPALAAAHPGEDLERNDGSTEKPYFIAPTLHGILNKRHLVPQKQKE